MKIYYYYYYYYALLSPIARWLVQRVRKGGGGEVGQERKRIESAVNGAWRK